ncbi:MAG TPA: glycosyltransferase [Actinobacteria bacterium]|jgi:Glyoxalase-like domain|nr:glycosyltransferase [Actinomycetota bacterium]
MRLDHLSYSCTTAEIADVIQRIGGDLGATFVDGGRHPSFGTRNFILPLAHGCYVEVVSALDHPAAEKAPFGRAVAASAADGGGWFSWVVAVDDISPVEGRLGREARAGHRIRPDGVELTWKQIGILNVMEDPQLPFFVEWSCQTTEHPSAGGSTVAIDRIEMSGDPDAIADWLGTGVSAALEGITVEWVDGEEPGIVAVWFATPHGSVRID